MKQYFSKLHNKWIDIKPSDCESELKKYGYKIREKEKSMLDLINAGDKEGLKQMHEDVKKGKVICLIG